MTLLLDTHAILGFFWEDPQLSAAALDAIADPNNRKLVSTASCWEISIKASIGKLKLGEPAHSFLERHIVRNNFVLLPVSFAHATAVETLPFHHRDPLDRLLVAQAQVEGIAIVSGDEVFDAYGGSRIW